MVNKIGLDEGEEEDEGRTADEIEEAMREKEARAHAQILEMVSCIYLYAYKNGRIYCPTTIIRCS